MLNKSLSRIALMSVLVLALGACGDDSGSSGPSFPDSVSTADAEDFAEGVAEFASQVAYGLNFNGPSIGLAAPAMLSRLQVALPAPAVNLRGVPFAQPDLSLLDWRQVAARARGPQFSAAEGCTVTIRGSWDPYGEDLVDENENGIPDDFYMKVECEETEEGDGDTVYTATTIQEVAFKEIAASLYGQSISILISQREQDNYGHYVTFRYDIDARQDIRSDGIDDEASFTFRVEQKLTDDPAVFEEAGESWDNAFDPDGTIALESNIPDGELTIGGRRYYANSNDDNLSFTVSTPVALAYDAACALADDIPPFSAGELLGKLNNSSSQASFEVTFTACGSYTVDVDGAYDEPMVAVR